MNTNEDKHIEKLIDKMLKDQTLETPSFDFTSKVLSQVTAIQSSRITTYKPLLSKKTVLIIISILLALIVFSIFYDSKPTSNWIPHIEFIPFKNLTTSYEFSKVTTYSVVLTAIMIFIQIPILKNYYDRKFDA
ncbi:hypothetical protein [Flavobacterium sp. GCM10023249]|uniref:hypothetical protein n=1 Tax=unclassified Flavobacterium TaxID=196869 RepID=UPI0036186715